MHIQSRHQPSSRPRCCPVRTAHQTDLPWTGSKKVSPRGLLPGPGSRWTGHTEPARGRKGLERARAPSLSLGPTEAAPEDQSSQPVCKSASSACSDPRGISGWSEMCLTGYAEYQEAETKQLDWQNQHWGPMADEKENPSAAKAETGMHPSMRAQQQVTPNRTGASGPAGVQSVHDGGLPLLAAQAPGTRAQTCPPVSLASLSSPDPS